MRWGISSTHFASVRLYNPQTKNYLRIEPYKDTKFTMIDYLKFLRIVFTLNVKGILNNPLLEGRWNITSNNDAVLKDETGYYNMRFTFKDGNLKIDGSIHKYRNYGLHNYDDFTCMEAIEVLKQFCEDFGIDPHRTEINNLEFGVNVVLPFPVKLVLDNLISYKGEYFTKEVRQEIIKGVSKGIRYYQFKKSQYYLKIYDKGLQYGLPDDVLRFEVKVIRKQFFQWLNIPIYWLSDLFNPDIYQRLAEVLNEVFNDIIFNDNRIEHKKLTPAEQIIYHRANSLSTWTPNKNPNTKEGKDKTEREKKDRQKLRAEFESLLTRHRTGENFRYITAEKIRQKGSELSRSYRNAEKVLVLDNTAPNEGIFPFLHLTYNRRKGNFYHKDKRLCSGCFKPLADHQRTYHSMECKLDKDERNARSNPRNNFKKLYKKQKNKPSLYNFADLVKLTEEQRKWIS